MTSVNASPWSSANVSALAWDTLHAHTDYRWHRQTDRPASLTSWIVHYYLNNYFLFLIYYCCLAALFLIWMTSPSSSWTHRGHPCPLLWEYSTCCAETASGSWSEICPSGLVLLLLISFPLFRARKAQLGKWPPSYERMYIYFGFSRNGRCLQSIQIAVQTDMQWG